jgi:hypothetical protein
MPIQSRTKSVPFFDEWIEFALKHSGLPLAWADDIKLLLLPTLALIWMVGWSIFTWTRNRRTRVLGSELQFWKQLLRLRRKANHSIHTTFIRGKSPFQVGPGSAVAPLGEIDYLARGPKPKQVKKLMRAWFEGNQRWLNESNGREFIRVLSSEVEGVQLVQQVLDRLEGPVGGCQLHLFPGWNGTMPVINMTIFDRHWVMISLGSGSANYRVFGFMIADAGFAAMLDQEVWQPLLKQSQPVRGLPAERPQP